MGRNVGFLVTTLFFVSGVQQARSAGAFNKQHFDAMDGALTDTLFGVPMGVTKLTIHAFGAGGRAYNFRSLGGPGAHATVDIDVTEGEMIAFRIGRTGAVGTTNGGEATMVFGAQGNLLAVAGGGGGGGGLSLGGAGGALVGEQSGFGARVYTEDKSAWEAGGGGQVRGGMGGRDGTMWTGALPAQADCGGGGGGLYGGASGVMHSSGTLKCSGGGGGSSYVNTSAVRGYSLYTGDDQTIMMNPAAAALRETYDWGKSDKDGHVMIEMFGEGAMFREGCGMTADQAATSCDAIKDKCPSSPSGMYFLEHAVGEGASQIHCELDMFLGGWALAGVYVPDTPAMPTSGHHVGPAVFTHKSPVSAMMSDTAIQEMFGEAVYMVQARTLEQVENDTTGRCLTYYRPMVPKTYSSTEPYSAMRCSLDGRLWGAAYRPDGYGLTTQSGMYNYAKTSCGASEAAVANSSQWVYTYMPFAVNGRDLCVNNGDDQTAHKMLYVRPIAKDEDGNEITIGASPDWKLVIPQSSKVQCNDRQTWPFDGHPVGMPDHMSLTDCQLACEEDPECNAIDYSPNMDQALDDSGLVRSKCFFHRSLADCNNFKPSFTSTYNFEIWELHRPDPALVNATVDPADEAAPLPDPMKQPCTGSGPLLHLTRAQAITVRQNRLSTWTAQSDDAMLRDRLVSMVETIIDGEVHEMTGALPIEHVALSDDWQMAFNGKVGRAIAEAAMVKPGDVNITVQSSPRGFGLPPGGQLLFAVKFGTGSAAIAAERSLRARTEDGSLFATLSNAGLSSCVEKGQTETLPDVTTCVIDTSMATLRVRMVAHGSGRNQPGIPDVKEEVQAALRSEMTAELKLLTRTELVEMAETRQIWHQDLPASSELREEIIEEQLRLKTIGELQTMLSARLQGNVLRTMVDSTGCIAPLGFTFCTATQECVQDWKGGVNGPCEGGFEKPSLWDMLSPAQVRQQIMTLGRYQLKRMRTVDLLEDINADEFELGTEAVDLTNLGLVTVGSNVHTLPSSTSCPPHSHGYPRCLCDAGFFGVIDVYGGTGACYPTTCPPNSAGISPNCRCAAGTIGSVSWGGPYAGWLGSCDLCAEGTWPSDQGECVKVPIPESAELDGSVVRCREGFGGVIKWIPFKGTYEGTCIECTTGTASRGGKPCQKMPCPENSVPTADNGCECVAGYEGEVFWNGDEQEFEVSTGSCRPCVAGTYKSKQGAASCTACSLGFWSIIGATGCEEVPCPDKTVREDGSCVCRPKYTGVMSFKTGYWGGSCEICPEGYRANDDNSACILIECPSNSKWPSCQCDVDYYGSPAYVPSETRVVGKCQSCGEGYACPFNKTCVTQTDCVKIECPVQTQEPPRVWDVAEGRWTGGHPKCECLDGEYGVVLWSNITRTYTRWCQTCPLAEWSDTEQKAVNPLKCRKEECPPGSTGYPLCRCKTGYVGSVGWDVVQGRWSGACAKCADGFWSAMQTDLECEPVGCPEGASGWPRCECDLENAGRGEDGTNTLTWDESTGRWIGTCDDKCPPHSAGYPDCTCVEGTVGSLQLQGRKWFGSCSPCPAGTWAVKGDTQCTKIACPASSVPATGPNATGCECPAGTHGTIVQSQWRNAGECRGCPVGFRAEGTGCVRIKCPAGSYGHPSCECLPGYHGQVTWDADAVTYKGKCEACPEGTFAPYDGRTGECIRSSCPPHSGGWPHCVCDEMYEGTVTWDRLMGKYIGNCTACSDGMYSILEKRIASGTALSIASKSSNLWTEMRCEVLPCPDGAGAWPNCVCKQDRFGTLELKDSAWYGSCQRCDVGFFPEPKARKTCVETECPAHSSGHPKCECEPGYVGTLRFDPTTGMYVGRCIECGPGTYAPLSAGTACLRCPEGTSSGTAATFCSAKSVKCPFKSSVVGGNRCVCDAGYEGELTFLPAISEYSGKCTQCMPGWWSSPGTGVCKKVECPYGADHHPLCTCQPGFAGAPVWDQGSWNGKCTRCDAGRVPTTMGMCVAARCPPKSSFATKSNKCECSGNNVGFLMWDAVTAVNGTSLDTSGYVGTCDGTCSTGYTPNDGNSACIPVPCPANAAFHPFCTCLSGYAGTLKFAGGEWKGECTMCEPGEWNQLGQGGKCSKIKCPPNSSPGKKGCVCKEGFAGQLSLVDGVYRGTCTSVGCPRNAVRDEKTMTCACLDAPDVGGRIKLKPQASGALDATDYMGGCSTCNMGEAMNVSHTMRSCSAVPCPPGSVPTGAGVCGCAGDRAVGHVEWRGAGSGWNAYCNVCPIGFRANADKTQCEQVQCPAGSDGWPSCKCLPEHGGKELVFDEKSSEYVGRCSVICPKGKLVNEITGLCYNVTCPAGTSGRWPDCQCGAGQVGDVLWLPTKGWLALCQPCPNGTVTRLGGRSCDPAPLPKNTVNANAPECADGLVGAGYGWSRNTSSWVPVGSHCSKCVGETGWSIDGSSCERLACPGGTKSSEGSSAPLCSCTGNKMGGYIYYVNKYVGRCYPREDAVFTPLRIRKVKKVPPTEQLGFVEVEEPVKMGCAMMRNESEPNCTSTCEGAGGTVWRTKQYCAGKNVTDKDACWCVDPMSGLEIPNTRALSDPYHPLSCKALSCASLDGLEDCAGQTGDILSMKMSKSFTVSAWARLSHAEETLRQAPMRPNPIFGTVLASGSKSVLPPGRIADPLSERAKKHNVTVWMGFVSNFNETLNRTDTVAMASVGEYNITAALPVYDGPPVWHHISMTFKSSWNISLYVNGTLVNSTTLLKNGEEPPLLANPVLTTPVHIGAYSDGVKPTRYLRGSVGSIFFSGKVEEVDAIAATMKDSTAPSSFEVFSFSDNGYGQPQILQSSNRFGTKRNLACATTPCTDNPGRAYTIPREYAREATEEGTKLPHGFVRSNFQARTDTPDARYFVYSESGKAAVSIGGIGMRINRGS